MNLVILCNHPNSTYASDLLQALNDRRLEGIHVVALTQPEQPVSLSSLWATHGLGLPFHIFTWVMGKVHQRIFYFSSSPDSQSLPSLSEAVENQGGTYCPVSEINGESCRNTLQSLQVDLIILAGAPIVRSVILDIPRIGTLNAHQGPLPTLRGMNVIEWAVLLNIPPALSIHFVNPGVDTGDILVVEEIPLSQGDTLQSVRSRASCRQTQLLAETTLAVLEDRVKGRSQTLKQGRQYFVMHPIIRAFAEECLANSLKSD